MIERTQELFEQIESYLDERMAIDDRLVFEQKIANNPDLKREVDIHRSLHESLADTDMLTFRKKIQKIAGEINDKHSPNTINKRVSIVWKVAASLALLIGISTFWWLQTNANSNLFDSYYIAYPIEDITRGTDKNEIDDILHQYALGKYDDVTPKLIELVEKEPEKMVYQLYLGNCFLNIGLEKDAIRVFEKFAKENALYEDAQWYLALSYLKIEDMPNTMSVLKNIVIYDGVHKKEAEALLHELKAPKTN